VVWLIVMGHLQGCYLAQNEGEDNGSRNEWIQYGLKIGIDVDLFKIFGYI
jgi:hypothetical protein